MECGIALLCENTPVRFHKTSFAFISFLLLGSATLVYGSDTKSAEMAGAVLYRDKGCGFCHGANLEGTKKAPALAEIRKQKAMTNEKISNQILDGGTKMPPFRESLSDEEIQQLISFLRAKNRPVAPPPAAPQQ
jgi:mono/diheme cytochrome c family protein